MDKNRVERRNKQGYFAIDFSYMKVTPSDLERHENLLTKALESMKSLEAGALSNPDEQRQVGHYWLRDSSRAPTPKIQNEISSCLLEVKQFVSDIRDG